MVRITVFGAAGRMGRRVVACAGNYKDVEIVGGVEQSGNPAIGKDIGELAGIGHLGINVIDSVAGAVGRADVCIDFTSHTSTMNFLPVVAGQRKPFVICTTGFSDSELEKIRSASEKMPVILSPNMSIGVNLLFEMVKEFASRLGSGYDTEIIELHHNKKKDSPSGTAAKLAEILAKEKGINLAEKGVYGRKGLIGERDPSEIGIHAVRAGDIVGEHTVIFAGPGERIELTHRAHSRDTFANGALKAAIFLAGKSPGMYSMKDVLSSK